MIESIRQFTTKQLEKELARRKKDGSYDKPGKDWYYLVDDDDSDTIYPSIYIVSKEFWDKNKHIDDRHLSHLLVLPQGMSECMEACFDFDYTIEEAEEQLQELGYTKLEKM